ncbi:DEAD/DEAH box helicase [Verrucomicrobiota bacterium]
MKNKNAPSGVFGLLLPEIGRAVSEAGYKIPSPIQRKTIPSLLEGRDMLGCAQTGTGKTAAFMLPILQYLAKNKKHSAAKKPRVLILAPTRELAAQIRDSAARYGKYTRTTHAVIFGGVGQNPQVIAMRRGVQVLVATPGRLIDLVNQKHIDLAEVEIFVLDEADRMLDMGFIHDIRKIIAMLPKKRQSLFYSATMEPKVIELARTLVHNPVHVTIAPKKPAVECIVQKVMFVSKENKDDLITDLLKSEKMDRVMVFVQMKHIANHVARKLELAGISAAAIHGNKSQTARTRALADFKAGKTRVLVATDIAARGIDVDSISHVINYNMPVEPETYVHRIGRTARAGSDGDAISFCCAPERNYLHAIEKLIRTNIPVDFKHAFHCEKSKNATGADAKPAPRGQRNRGRRPPRGRGK